MLATPRFRIYLAFILLALLGLASRVQDLTAPASPTPVGSTLAAAGR